MEILLVGTVHLGETTDLHTLSEEDVRTYKEEDFERLVASIATIPAQQVFVEYPAHSNKHLNTMYKKGSVHPDFQQNEIYQIGFRLAKKLGLHTIEAVDWNEQPPGAIDLGHVAQGPAKAQYEAIMGRVEKMVAQVSAQMAKGDIIELFRAVNTPDYMANDHQIYVDLMELDDDIAFEWVANYWYYRNLRIARNVKRALKPDTERAVVIYGAGHNYLLKNFLEQDAAIRVMLYE